jgi:hypothetical protein
MRGNIAAGKGNVFAVLRLKDILSTLGLHAALQVFFAIALALSGVIVVGSPLAHSRLLASLRTRLLSWLGHAG